MAMRDLVALIGTRATWRVDGLSVPVTIVDVREVFGRVDVLITPIGGAGEKWTDRVNVETSGGKGK